MGGAGEGGAGEGAALPLLPAPRGVRHAFLPRHAVGPEAGHAQHPALGPNLVASLTKSILFYIQALQKLNFTLIFHKSIILCVGFKVHFSS